MMPKPQRRQGAHRSLQERRVPREAPACTKMMLLGCSPIAVEIRNCRNGICGSARPCEPTSGLHGPKVRTVLHGEGHLEDGRGKVHEPGGDDGRDPCRDQVGEQLRALRGHRPAEGRHPVWEEPHHHLLRVHAKSCC